MDQRTHQSRISALIRARTGLDDDAEGSVLSALAGAFAFPLAALDRQIEGIKSSFRITDQAGAQLDARASQLGLVRRPPSRARVEVTLTAASPITLSAGAGYASLTGEVYALAADQALAVGVNVIELSATIAGGGQNGYTVIAPVSIPSGVTLTSATTSVGGLGEETDAELRHRAHRHLSGLTGATLARLESEALGADLRLNYAHAVTEAPGRAVVHVDDGSGALGATLPGTYYAGQAPAEGLSLIAHDAPCPESPQVETQVGGVWGVIPAQTQPERGIIVCAVPAGVNWRLGQYRRYTTIAPLQAAIDAVAPAGIRVIVAPALGRDVALDIFILPAPGYTYREAQGAARARIGSFFSELRPGAPAYRGAMAGAIVAAPELATSTIYRAGTGGGAAPVLIDDIYPASPSEKLRLGAITFFSSSEAT